MKRSIILLFTVFMLTSCVEPKRMTILTVPTTSTTVEEVDIAAYEKKYGEYDGVYLDKEYSLEHISGQGGTLWAFYELSKEKYLILNPADEDLSTFELTIRKSTKLSKIYLRIIYPNKEIKQFGIDNLHREKTSENLTTYKFVYPNVTKGTIIEEGYELSYKAPDATPPLRHNIDLEFIIPCEKYKFSYIFPAWWTIQTKKVSDFHVVKVNFTEEENKNIITYSALNIPAYKIEPYAPSLKEGGKCFQFQVVQMSLGPISITMPVSWHKAVENFIEYATKKDEQLSAKVLNTTNDLIKDTEDPIERMEAIITYLQENIEISNDGKSRNFKDILKDKHGDIFRITGLAQSMLLEAGIDAKYLLLHSAEDGYFDKSYISPDQISNPAIGVKLDNRTYVIFPYLKIPIGYIPENFQDQVAISISLGEESEYSVDFWDIPVNTDAKNRLVEFTDLNIDKEGNIHVKEEKMFYGYLAIGLREMFKNLKEDEQKKAIEKLLTYDEGIAELTSFNMENLEAYKKPLSIKLEYNLDDLVTVLPDEVIFQTGGLFSPSSGAKHKIDSDKRYNPIKISYDKELIKRITIHFPKSWSPTTPLKDVYYSNRFGEIEGKYSIEEGKITVTQYRILKKNNAPKEEILELDEIVGPQSSLFIPSIIFRKE